jgi:hypothetical protein
MKPAKIHAAAGAIAFLTILAFWVSTLVAELFLSAGAIAAVKVAIVYGMLLLVPAIATAGASGHALARRRPGAQARRKAARMRVIAANGLFVMMPAALYLQGRACQGQMDGAFYAVQAVELVVGAIQLYLMGRNIRDGRLLAGRVPADGTGKGQAA